MNYRSRTYVDLHVIDAIDQLSLCDWGLDADALQNALADTSIHIVPHKAETVTMLIEVIDQIRTFRRSYMDPRHSVPYIHISCHGEEAGLIVGEGERLSWRALSQVLLPLLEATDYHLALSLSSCWGYHGLELAHVMNAHYRKRRPYYSLVGPLKDENIPELFQTFGEFYRRLLANFESLKTAVELANRVARPQLGFTKGSRVRHEGQVKASV